MLYRTHHSHSRKLRRAFDSLPVGLPDRNAIRLEALDSRVLLNGAAFATVLHDANGNGIKDPDEPMLEGWTVFVDYDRNGSLDAGEPSVVTNIDGEGTISDIPKGTWDVVEILPAGWSPAPGFDSVDRVNVRDGETTDVLFLNVTSSNGNLEGTVWNDLNNDGFRDPTDLGLVNWTVFLDTDHNGNLDVGEPFDLTDSNGYYLFSDLTPGQYRVREVVPPNWDPTVGFDNGYEVNVDPASTTVQDFANFSAGNLGSISGVVWNDVNADGFRAPTDPGLSDWTVFVDINGNTTLDADTNGDGIPNDPEPSALSDGLGVYTFPAIPAGAYTVREILQPDWNVSPGHDEFVNVNVVGENNSVADFANYTLTLGSISGTVWNDQDGNGFLNGEPGLEGWTIFDDQNSDGVANPGEPSAISDANGNYVLTSIPIGAQLIREVATIGWKPTAPGTGMQLVNMLNGDVITGIDFGNQQRTDSAIGGRAFSDANHNGVRDTGERGLSGITIYLDANNNGSLDSGEQSMATLADFFYTPAVDEAGTYAFTHLGGGDYVVREILPVELSATLAEDRVHSFTLLPGEDKANVNFANRYRPNEIHGTKFDDQDNDHTRDAGEPGLGGVTVYLDLNRDNIHDAGEPTAITAPDGSYAFTDLSPGAYVVRDIELPDREHTYPTTTGGILWPDGVSHPAIGNVTPTSITASLATGQTLHQTVSLTLPATGALTNLVDVFLLFDDTGSFTSNSPIVRAAFPTIISTLQASLPGIDLGFGVGRLEEYANFAAEFGTGRPFILNQPIVASTTAGFSTSIQAALDREAPGYGGDQPETDIEALFQMVTGRGFDGNNNGSLLDSGAAGLVSTQLNPGNSGDVPPFSSFTPDASGSVLPAAGTLGGAGFRAGALPIILTATDTGFAYQPKGETTVTGVNGLTLPVSALTETSRPTTPFDSGAGLQETVTGLNALGALVIGLGTNPQANLDPRQGLESLAKLTGAINQTTTTIANGTLDPISPGDPFYFEISSGFGTSVANGIVTAIQNAVSNVAVNITLKASDPRVHIISLPGVINGVGAGQTATFDVEFTGDGIPHRFDLQFVREGTDVVLGSIPVVLGTPIPGDGYDFEDCKEGEIHSSVDFGSHSTVPVVPASSVTVLPASVSTTAFDVAWSGVDYSGTGIANYDIFISDNGGAFSLWLDNTVATTASYQGDTFHNYAFYSVATDNLGGVEAAPAGADTSTLVAAIDGTAGDDALTLRMDPADPSVLLVFRSAPPIGSPDYSIGIAALPALAVHTLDGADQVVVDSTHGAPIPEGGLTFDAGAGADTLRLIGAAADSVQINPSAIAWNGLAIGHTAESIQIAPGGGTNLTLTGDVNATLIASADLASLALNDVSRLTMAPSAAIVLRTTGLAIGAGAALDITDNDVVVQSTAGLADADLAAITALLATGRNAGPLWTGPGINSSAAANDASRLTGVAIQRNITPAGLPIRADFDGVAVDENSILIKYTWNGDMDLTGTVDADDYFRIDSGFAASDTGYSNGDIDYSGTVDADDYFLIDSAFGGQTGALAAPKPAAAVVIQRKSTPRRKPRAVHHALRVF